MTHYPTTLQQYVELGKLLAAVLDIRVDYSDGLGERRFGPGWMHGGSDLFGVSNGNFRSDDDAYSDLAALCMDACYSRDERYRGFMTDEGREVILSSIQALGRISDLMSLAKKSTQPTIPNTP